MRKKEKDLRNNKICLSGRSTPKSTTPTMRARERKEKKLRKILGDNCELCGGKETPYSPLGFYSLDGGEASLLPSLTVLLCGPCYLMTRRAWPPGAGFQNGLPVWAFKHGRLEAVRKFQTDHGPKKKKAIGDRSDRSSLSAQPAPLGPR